ncbi:hypothetical protein Tco_1004813 [Tanacetum coccineum]|uniref:Uncharacterized protein n=1 Tax=Tanacetum coccineum TaxID=301880 RepID=A0ABQ5FD91_9ASTR
MTVPATVEEKICKKNDVKARSLLLMALPNEHQLSFDQYTYAKTLFAAIKARFGVNKATKKTQKTLLKQQYENFNGSRSDSLDSIFNILQRIVSRLAILEDIETLSIDDLYNNFKIVGKDVKKSVGSSTGSQNLAFVTAQSTSSTNVVNTANPDVSTVSPNVNTASSNNDTATLSDAIVYAFLANQPKGSQLVYNDLQQLHDNDLEEMDLKWNLALLSIRARKFYQRTGRKITIDGSDTARFDKSKSDMAEAQVHTNMALMAFLDSEIYTEKSCLKICLKNRESLKKQCDDLFVKLNDIEFKEATYKRSLTTVEEYELCVLRTKLEKVKQENEGIDFKITKFENASKDLDKLLENQRSDKNKQGIGYHAVAPPHPLTYNRPSNLDLSYSGLNDFKEPEFDGYGPRDTMIETTKHCFKESDNSKENTDDSEETEQVFEDTCSSLDDTCSLVESPFKVDRETVIDWHKTGVHTDKKEEFVKPKINEKLGNPQMYDKGFVDSECSRHMTGNIAYLLNFKEFDGGHVTFGGGAYGGRIFGKGTLKTDSLDFNDVEENLHVGFLENKPIIEENGPQWLFNIDSLTQSMNYVPVTAGTNTNESAGTQGDLNEGTYTRKDGTNPECIMMPIWKDTTYFDLPSKDVSNDDIISVSQSEDGPDDKNDDQDKSIHDSSLKEVNTVDSQVNTASLGVNIGSSVLNTAESPINTAASNDKSRASPTSKATHLKYLNDEDEPEVNLGNIPSSYTVPTTPYSRVHINHPLSNIIGDIQLSVQTRRMKGTALEQGFLSAIYEENTHEDLHTCLFACFLLHKEPTRVTKALSDPLWVEIEEEVYVCQPLRFEDPDYPDKVYKVVKALYGLHQALRACFKIETNKVKKDSSKKFGGKRKKSLARKRTRDTVSEETSKKQKVEEDVEKEDLKVYLNIVPGDDVAIDVDSLFIKYLIVDWKTYVVSETFMYYQVFRADGSSKNYKILSEMLEEFDR